MSNPKADIITLKSYGYARVVFAENSAKAKAKAVGTFDDVSYDGFFDEIKDMKAKRYKEADNEYRGHAIMDWDDSDDRLFLVKNLNYACSDETDLDCEGCIALEYCPRKEEWLEIQEQI